MQKVCMSPSHGAPQSGKVLRRMATGHQAFRGMLRQPKEESSEAQQEAGVIPQRPLSFPQPLPGPRGLLGSLPCTQGACLCQAGHLKEARSPPADGDKTLGFQGDVEAARKEKLTRLRRTLGPTPGGQCLSGIPCTRPGCSWDSWVAPRMLVAFMVGTPKKEEGPWGMGIGGHALSGMLRQTRGKSCKAEKAGVLTWSLMPHWKALSRVRGARVAPGLHPGCVSLSPIGGTPKQQECSWMGTRHQSFRKMLRQPGKRKAARVLSVSPLPSQQDMH